MEISESMCVRRSRMSRSFADSMIQAGVYPKTIDLKRAYTLRFVNKKVGMEIKAARGVPAPRKPR